MPNLKVKFLGLFDLTKLIGNDEFDIHPEGETLGDTLKCLEEKFGPPFRQTILNEKGEVNDVIQVLKNEEEYLLRDDLVYRLEDGDELFFLFMIAGG